MLLSARELELVLMGAQRLDLDDWRRNATYAGAFEDLGASHPVARLFWDEVSAWTDERRALLLLWCTGSSQVPAQGFARLQGRDGVVRPFTVVSVDRSVAAYPRAHTCFNRIDLPLYETREALATAFDVALAAENAMGFSMD